MRSESTERLVPSDEPFARGARARPVPVGHPLQPLLPGRDRRVAGPVGRPEAGGIPTAVRLELAVAGLTRTTPVLVVALPMGNPRPSEAAARPARLRTERGLALIVVLVPCSADPDRHRGVRPGHAPGGVTTTPTSGPPSSTLAGRGRLPAGGGRDPPGGHSHDLDLQGRLSSGGSRLVPGVPRSGSVCRWVLAGSPTGSPTRPARLNVNRATPDLLRRLCSELGLEPRSPIATPSWTPSRTGGTPTRSTG